MGAVDCMDLRMAVTLLQTSGIDLGARTVTTFYPKRGYQVTPNPPRTVFSVDLFSSEGRNVATFMPDLGRLLLQPGAENRGREWSMALSEDQMEGRLPSAWIEGGGCAAPPGRVLSRATGANTP